MTVVMRMIKNDTAFGFKTWVHSGATPWKVGYFTHGDFIAGSTGYPTHLFYTTPGTSPSYIPTLYVADAVGQIVYGNPDVAEPFNGDGEGNYTVPNGPNGMFSLLCSTPGGKGNPIGDYWFAWPIVKAGNGIWWAENLDDWD